MKSQRLEAGQIIADLRHQLASGVHTWSECSRKCGNSARGGRICLECLSEKLEKIVGLTLTFRFTQSLIETERLREEILSKAEKGT